MVVDKVCTPIQHKALIDFCFQPNKSPPGEKGCASAEKAPPQSAMNSHKTNTEGRDCNRLSG